MWHHKGILTLFIAFFALAACSGPGHVAKINVPPAEVLPLNEDRAFERFSKALQIPTISLTDPALIDSSQFYAFIEFVQREFPYVFEELDFRLVNDFGMLFHWPSGVAPIADPVLFTAHYDVVPIDSANIDMWKHDPFSGYDDGEFIWGRGALDDKGGVMSILEGISYLINQGFTPNRDLWFAFGHDEEVGGTNGAAKMGDYLEEKGVRFEFTIDEGMPIVMELHEDLFTPVSFIGVTERGNMYLELSVDFDGGHSSLAASETAITVLAQAISKLADNPIPGRLEGLGLVTLEAIAVDTAPFMHRVALSNLWLFRGLVERRMHAIPGADALLGTTAAPTMFSSGVNPNVLPSRATAVINFRIHPRDTKEEVVEYVRRTIGDERISLTMYPSARNPAPFSSTESMAYRTIEHTILEIFPDVITAPSIFLAGTDSRHYQRLSDNVYRVRTIRAYADDASRVHGVNERLHKENYLDMIRFQIRLMKNLTSGKNFLEK